MFYATLTRLGQGCHTRFPRYCHRVFVIDFSPIFCGEMAELQEAVIVPWGCARILRKFQVKSVGLEMLSGVFSRPPIHQTVRNCKHLPQCLTICMLSHLQFIWLLLQNKSVYQNNPSSDEALSVDVIPIQ